MRAILALHVAALLPFQPCTVVNGLTARGTSAPVLREELLGNFIVVPEHRLLFCYIQKVGCANFNDLFRRVRSRYDPKQAGGRRWHRNTPTQHNLTKADLERLLVNKTWHKAVFYREPVERFISAYTSKCGHADSRDGKVHCRKQFGKDAVSFERATEFIAQFDAQHAANDDIDFDPHWKRMGRFCGGLDLSLRHYDTVKKLSIDNSRRKVRRLLQNVGVRSSSVEGFDDLFPKKRIGKEGFANSDFEYLRHHTTNASGRMPHLFHGEKGKERLKVLTRHYWSDYELFGEKLPDHTRF